MSSMEQDPEDGAPPAGRHRRTTRARGPEGPDGTEVTSGTEGTGEIMPGADRAAPFGELSGTAAIIAERASELFANKGFSSTSIREIAEAADVTKPMVYYYFGSKQGLIRHILTDSFGVLHRALAELNPQATLQEALQHLAERQLTFADEHPAVVALLARLDVAPPSDLADSEIHAHREAVRDALHALFARGLQRREVGTDAAADPLLLALTYGGAVMMHMMVRIQRPCPVPLSAREAARRLVTLFLDGARPRAPEPR